MINFILLALKAFFAKQPFTGVKDDNRPQAEKDNDVQHEEVYGATTTQWSEKTKYKHFSLRDQTFWGSSCLAHSATKASEIKDGVVGSAKSIYYYRSNKGNGTISSAGMIPANALQILATQGVTSEELLPSNGIQELDDTFTETDAMKAVENITKGGTPIKLPVDIDTIAGVVNQGYGVILCVRFAQAEWVDVPVVTSVYTGIYHGVCVVDSTLYKGQKCLVIEDSWLPATTIGKSGQRLITEEFLLARCTYAGYVAKIASPVLATKPIHTFTTDLKYGDVGNEVKLLQDRLRYEGFFKLPESTGNFLSVTRNAVIAYQKAHDIFPQAGYVGKITRGILNST